MKIDFLQTDDRSGGVHRLRADRINAYYLFHDADSCWKISIVFFGGDTPYIIEFENNDAAGKFMSVIDDFFEINI